MLADLKPGSIAPPVRAFDGYYIVSLIDRRTVLADTPAAGLDREAIRQDIAGRRLEMLAGATYATCTDRRSSTYEFDRRQRPRCGGHRRSRRARPLPPLSAVIARHGLQPRRALGQHFLLDPSLCGRIARAAQPGAPAVIMEVGPGPGGLTRALLDAGAARVVAVEKDRRCVARARRARGALFRSARDRRGRRARRLDIATLGPARIGIVANLPYNVGTRLLLRWLTGRADREHDPHVSRRKWRCGSPRPAGRDYGRALGAGAVALHLRAPVRREPARLRAPPGVISTVVRLEPRATPLAPADPDALDAVDPRGIRPAQEDAAPCPSRPHPGTAALLQSAGISPEARAETLSVAEFCALATRLVRHTGRLSAIIPLAIETGTL